MEEGGFRINIAVVGMGLIGGSYAEALRKLNPENIYGIDVDKDALNTAINMGIIDAGFIDCKYPLNMADLVIVALYPEDTADFIRDNVEFFKPGAVITDTCGIKHKVVNEVISFLPECVDFVGGHPMAGKETAGIENASKDIFLNANYIITPHSGNKEENIELVEKMAKAIGCRNVIRVDTVEHDRIISYTSQLPHIIAVSLMNCEESIEAMSMFTGGSFRDATRVASINSKLWLQLFNVNSDYLIDEIEKFEGTLMKMKEAIKCHDMSTLEQVLKCADERRRGMF